MKTNKIIKLVVLFLTFLNFNQVIAQSTQNGIRCDWAGPQWVDNDSTFYTLSPDSILIVGKNKLYLNFQGNISLIRDFSLDASSFVQDFDIIDHNTWYAILKTSASQKLLKTINAGLSWQTDTSYYSALFDCLNSAPETIFKNQLQQFSNSDTLLLFCGYYFTGLVYSTDKGVSWQSGFRQISLPAFYQGFIECKNRYFIWGEQGDPFYAAMFEIAHDSIFSKTFMPPNCANGFIGNPVPGCYYSNSASISNGLNSCDTAYWDFRSIADSLCNKPPLSIKKLEQDKLKIIPNPASSFIEISLETNQKIEQITIHHISGKLVLIDDNPSINNKYSISEISSGYYIVQLHTQTKSYHKKLMITN